VSSFKYSGYVLLAMLALPLLVLGAYVFFGLFSSSENLSYFISTSFTQAMLHSVILSSVSSFISLLLGFIFSLGFYTLHTKRFKLFFILLLMTSFILQPVILLSVFQEVDFFLSMDSFWQSIIISIFHLSPLSGLAFIYIFSTLNSSSFQNALAIAPFRHVTKFIIFPQLKQFILALYFLLFILVFIDQAVPSILGYRTYTEDLLAQMTLMENIEQIALSALPSYLLVFVFIMFWYQLKQHIFYQEQMISLKGTLHLPFKWLGFLMLGFTIIYLLWMIFGLSLTFFNSDTYSLLQDNIEVISTSMGFALMTSFVTLCLALMIYYILEKHTHTIFQKLFWDYLYGWKFLLLRKAQIHNPQKY
jgi:ABC-type Fe3+ transport system permease subunit